MLIFKINILFGGNLSLSLSFKVNFYFFLPWKTGEKSAIVEDTKTMTVRVHFDAEVPYGYPTWRTL